MNETQRGSGRRDRILKAAIDIAAERGILHLTLDHVAERAQVSKGGLLYHFPTKEALLRDLAEAAVASFAFEVDRGLERGETFGRAFVGVAFSAVRNPCSIASIMAAVAFDPQFAVCAARQSRDCRTRLIREGLDPDEAEFLFLALEGLLLSTALGTSDRTEAEIRRVEELALRALTSHKAGE